MTPNNALEQSVNHCGPRLAAARSLWPAAQLGRYTSHRVSDVLGHVSRSAGSSVSSIAGSIGSGAVGAPASRGVVVARIGASLGHRLLGRRPCAGVAAFASGPHPPGLRFARVGSVAVLGVPYNNPSERTVSYRATGRCSCSWLIARAAWSAAQLNR
jgi:hypothetical protein